MHARGGLLSEATLYSVRDNYKPPSTSYHSMNLWTSLPQLWPFEPSIPAPSSVLPLPLSPPPSASPASPPSTATAIAAASAPHRSTLGLRSSPIMAAAVKAAHSRASSRASWKSSKACANAGKEFPPLPSMFNISLTLITRVLDCPIGNCASNVEK